MREKTHKNQLREVTMNWKLIITVRPEWDSYKWLIEWDWEHGVWVWKIPEDLDEIARTLNFVMSDGEVAKIVYESICEKYNQVLTKLQLELWTPECTQQDFPYYRDEHYTPITWSNTRDYTRLYTYGDTQDFWTSNYSIGVWATNTTRSDTRRDSINYLTAEEYEQKRDRGELEPWTMYLILN